jgi:DNA-directed RNA polymerase specialized sigma24 family protein
MMTGSTCDCLVCQLEKNLIAELSDERVSGEYRLLTAPTTPLSRFASPLELIEELHRPVISNHGPLGDLILRELLRFVRESSRQSMWQQILLLVFIPTIHRTTSQIAATFPAIVRDDVAQHALATLLEFLGSKELQTRQSHMAFTIARRVRRVAFRWAIHEARHTRSDDGNENVAMRADDAAGGDILHAEILLYQFLDDCQRAGWLSSQERNLLIKFKVEGVSCQELANRNGHSAVAIQHRIQRSLDRLRRLAKSPPGSLAEQLELFPL